MSPHDEAIRSEESLGDEELSVLELELQILLDRYDIAYQGNGQDEELSKEQLQLIQQLYERVACYRQALASHDQDFCDHELCRRYLVARQWDLGKAEDQLVSTLMWRAEEQPGKLELWQNPKAFANPLCVNLRVVGLDKEGRPICYTCFAEAHDRWDAEANTLYVFTVLEACQRILRQRRGKGLNKTATSRQCVFVIDFDGFGLRDQNPRSAILTAKLLKHFPEFLNFVALIDAPVLFNGVFRLISPLLDERVRSKIMFVKGKDADKFLQARLGAEAAKWIANETIDNKEKRAQARKGNPKKYWIAPQDPAEHDPRGIASYVRSDMYIKTPGDAFEEKRLKVDGITEESKSPRSAEEKSIGKYLARQEIRVGEWTGGYTITGSVPAVASQ
jgi:hypothetical protein